MSEQATRSAQKTPAGLPSKGVDGKKITADLDALIGSIDEVLTENAWR
jgi:hypothetical protein